MKINKTNYSLTKSRNEDHNADEFISPLPRAVLREQTPILLDGEWRFELDHDNKGLHEEWYIKHEFGHTAQWPGSIEQHMIDSHQGSQGWKDQVIAWYERDFPLPDKNGSQQSDLLQLTFGACGYKTTVWLNGILLQTIEGQHEHIGEYTSFSYELPEEILHPQNRLTVRIEDTMDANITRGKQESHVYKRGGIWYHTYTGAVRSVWLELVERNRLRSRVGVISIVEDRMVRFNLTTRIHDAGNYTIRLKVYHQDADINDTPIAEDDYSLYLDEGQKTQRLVLEVKNAQLWSPENPALYRLIAQLIDEKGRASQIDSNFGLRKVEARGCCVYLNNNPVYLDGILYQPHAATYDEIKNHMHAMKKLGCNLVRIHIAGVDPRIYKLADKMGMMLWVEIPSPHVSNITSRSNHFDELQRMLALMETHPSIIIWSLYNEDWGAQDIATNYETRKYIIDTYHYMLINHPQFLVVDNDGWQHISLEGRLKSDLLTAHIYTPDLDTWAQLLEKIVKGNFKDVTAFPLVIGDPFFYRGQVPFIVSEWGGFGFPNYGGPEDDKGRSDLIKKFKEELRKRPIAGDVYTQATNIEDEKNGLIRTSTGELKVPENLLKSSPR